LGLGILLAVPGAADPIHWGLAVLAGAAGLGCALLAMRRPRGAWCDLAFACALAVLAAHQPDLASTAAMAVSALGLALCSLGVALSGAAGRQVPLTAVARRAAGPLVLALGLAIVAAQAPQWLAPLVSARWAASLDARSAAVTAAAGALLLCITAGSVAARLSLRRRMERGVQP